ncbi:DUF6262 family protein [Nocardia sp. NPDC050630]|uniref:DUF6262 family protein n=1 Tax=Nocardia sp. NPDC050630 TaxID=3364321 RepID=UPI00379D2B2F
MRADNTAHLITAAQRRHELTRAKAIQALHELDQAGTAITFEALAQHADVSRSGLYSQPDIKDEIQRIRASQGPNIKAAIPSRQRGSDQSLRQRLDIANTRIRQLTEENQKLRRQLEQTLGQLRAERSTKPAAQHRNPVTIGPC